MDEETAMMLDWFNGWYSSKTHVKLCKISFFYQHKDELWIMMSDGRGLTYIVSYDGTTCGYKTCTTTDVNLKNNMTYTGLKVVNE